MREPAFWWQPPSWMSAALAPAGLVYGEIAGRRMTRPGYRAAVPVICVGNFSLGGAGKTPTVFALLNLLRAAGETPVVLSRGYGGRLAGPLLVDVQKHSADAVGDEPLLLARDTRVVVARDRVLGVGAACGEGATVIVMDDGLQNPSVQKDLALVVIDAGRGIGNARVFPAGPLRAPLATQLGCTDALLVVGAGTAADEVAAKVRARGARVLRARAVPDPQAVARLRGQQVMAFAGIGHPERFFATLRQAGIDVVATRTFADHHRFTAAELKQLGSDARAGALQLVTTEKDFVRLRGVVDVSGIEPLPITLVLDDEKQLGELVAAHLKAARAAIGRG